MEPATVNVLISAGAGLLGTGVGGLSTYWATRGQHKRQMKKERLDAQRDREQDAARECEALCVQMADDMEQSRPPWSSNWSDADSQRAERVEAAHRKLLATTLYLPNELKQRIEEIGSIIRNADDLSYGSPLERLRHYHQPYTICWHTANEVRAVVAAFVKDEPMPASSGIMLEYQAALDDLNKDRRENDSYYADTPEGEARRRIRDEFFSRHPALRPTGAEHDS